MITLVWRTDIHYADTSPSSRLDNWSDTILEKIRYVGKFAEEVSADAVIDGGDFFDRKSPSRTSHKSIIRIMESHRDYPCPVYSCVGNHDCVFGDYSFLDQQPLEVLFRSKTFRRLYDEHEATFVAEDSYDHHREDSFTVRVVGVPYHGTTYDLERFRAVKKGNEDYLVMVAHVLASAKGGSMFEGEDILSYDFLKTLDADVMAFGHWHK
ncbi:MAG: metallophosphoesterase, partial [Bacteroidota bacterium]